MNNKKIIQGNVEITDSLQVNTKVKVSEAPTEATDVVRKQELDTHTHNIHTQITIPLTQITVENTNPHKLIVKSNIQDVSINGPTTGFVENATYQTKNAEVLTTSDGYIMTTEDR